MFEKTYAAHKSYVKHKINQVAPLHIIIYEYISPKEVRLIRFEYLEHVILEEFNPLMKNNINQDILYAFNVDNITADLKLIY